MENVCACCKYNFIYVFLLSIEWNSIRPNGHARAIVTQTVHKSHGVVLDGGV